MSTAIETAPPKRYSRWRAATLASVYVLFGIHIAHWKIAGKTLAPLELNEVMYTLELGIVTAGFLFMVIAAASVVFFGRFFCSWACHILALEDLAAWLLKKVGIRPRPVRSRVLLLVPPLALFYMFIFPQVMRVMEGRPFPGLRVFTDLDGWGSFVTNDYWRNLPGPWITGFTFLVCGFLIVYILGSRSFCRYACPYGAVFALADRFAPGQIMAGENCEQCGKCTAACTSDIRGHEELKQFGRVVSSACLKDLDCVSVCPNDAVHFGFGKPSLFKSWGRTARRMKRYDFSLGEDLLMAGVFVATLFVFRGLYGAVPFLATLGLGAILAYLAAVCARIIRSETVRVSHLVLKRSGRLTPAGHLFGALAVVAAILFVHSAWIRYHEFTGERAYKRVIDVARTTPIESMSTTHRDALHRLGITERWGLFRHPLLDSRLATLHLLAGSARADSYLERIRARDPAEAHELVAELLAHNGELDRAVAAYRAAIDADPDRLESLLALAEILADRGELAESAEHLSTAAEIQPDSARIHYNLAAIFGRLGMRPDAIRSYRTTLALAPDDSEAHNNLGFLLAGRGEGDVAEEHFRAAIALAPRFSHPHFNLGRLLMDQGRVDEAREHLERAASLDPANYAHVLD